MKKKDIAETLDKEARRAEREEASEEEGRAYVRPRPPEGPSQVYSIRLPVDRLEELRRLAEARGEPPTTMIREWVLERLDRERAGDRDQVQEAIDHLRAGLDALQRLRSREGDESAAVVDPRAREELRDWLREVRKQVEEADLDPSVVDEAIAAAREMRCTARDMTASERKRYRRESR